MQGIQDVCRENGILLIADEVCDQIRKSERIGAEDIDDLEYVITSGIH
jgi:4-aminobutyrate aminotransferase and related aminotransferases